MTARLDVLIEQFECAWQRGEVVDLGQFWADHSVDVPAVYRPSWLHELIKVDLEYRWSRAGGVGGRLDNYAAQLPELGSDWPIDLIVEEWRARRRWGDRPDLDDYLRRFPNRAVALEAELRRAQTEMSREWHESIRAAVPEPIYPTPMHDPRAPLDYRDYELREMIGSGGMGKVYRAWQRSLDRPVAVKMLRKSSWTLPGAVERFLEEARVVARLRHPGIVGIHGVGRTPGGGPFIVMDFVDGCDLAMTMAQEKPSPHQAAEWIAEAALALDYTHGRGVVHCDLKPSNLLRENTGRILLSDFGLATSLTAPSGSRQWGGTPGFMAPEQLDAMFGEIGPATDIFALGLVLHFLLTGQVILQGRRPLDLLERWGEIWKVDVPPNLVAVLERCLALDPAARWLSAGALATALRAVV